MPPSTPDLDKPNEADRRPGAGAPVPSDLSDTDGAPAPGKRRSLGPDRDTRSNRQDDTGRVDIIGEIDNDTGDADKAPDRVNDRHLR